MSFGQRAQAERHFAQFGEDVLLKSLFGEGFGTYVDVGAGDPIRGSNTYLLYRAGWRGITIDPLRSNVMRARRKRPFDQQIMSLCGAYEGELMFHEFDPYELSTTSDERLAELNELGLVPKNQYLLPVKPLKSFGLLTKPSDRHVLCVDVEGVEVPVLDGIDWGAYRPAAICIEEWSSQLEGNLTTTEYLFPLGYTLKARVGLSSIFVHRESGLDWT